MYACAPVLIVTDKNNPVWVPFYSAIVMLFNKPFFAMRTWRKLEFISLVIDMYVWKNADSVLLILIVETAAFYSLSKIDIHAFQRVARYSSLYAGPWHAWNGGLRMLWMRLPSICGVLFHAWLMASSEIPLTIRNEANARGWGGRWVERELV